MSVIYPKHFCFFWYSILKTITFVIQAIKQLRNFWKFSKLVIETFPYIVAIIMIFV